MARTCPCPAACKAQYARVKDARGLVATAFGYAVRQEPGPRSLLDDGRLPMTNNHSERALRFICGGSERDRVADVGRRELPRRRVCVTLRSPSRTAFVQCVPMVNPGRVSSATTQSGSRPFRAVCMIRH